MVYFVLIYSWLHSRIDTFGANLMGAVTSWMSALALVLVTLWIMIQGYRPEQVSYGTGGPPFVENMYTADLLRAAFAEFDTVHLAEYDREQPEGMQHQGGMCALIDMVARKR